MGVIASEGDLVGGEPVKRLIRDVNAALRRKPTQEARLAGALRALAPFSGSLRAVLVTALAKLTKRGSYDRALYAAAVRSLAELESDDVVEHLSVALADDNAGGLASLSAACFSQSSDLAEPLARLAMSRQPQLAFAAEVARAARGESTGAHLVSVAPKIKESHRIALCVELLVPLLRGPRLPETVAPALAILRDAERHLGRWLVLAEVAGRAGDDRPRIDAETRAQEGPASSRAAWSLVSWALREGQGPTPRVRPTVELVARLSDRPSSDRDPTFLYRLASAGVEVARPMLESMSKGGGLGDAAGIRAALYLVKGYERGDLRRTLTDIATSSRKEALRGMAAAALYDVGERERCRELLGDLMRSRQLQTVAWAGLIRAAEEGALNGDAVVVEPRFRRVQQGWLE